MEHMKKLGVSGLVLASGVLIAATGIARAEETGLASIHTWVKAGRKTCLADHFHNGSGNGATRALAERAAVQSWADFTAWEYGGSWGRYALAASKKMTCSRDENWSCDLEARPCRPN
jgi:hypothetical protein